MSSTTVIVCDGDQTGQELLAQSLRVLGRDAVDLDINFVHFDLSLATRRATNNQVVHEAAAADGIRSFDLGGSSSTTEIVDEVVARVRRRLTMAIPSMSDPR